MFKRILFFRLLENLIYGPRVKECEQESSARNHCPVNLLAVESKVFEKPVNEKFVSYLQVF